MEEPRGQNTSHSLQMSSMNSFHLKTGTYFQNEACFEGVTLIYETEFCVASYIIHIYNAHIV